MGFLTSAALAVPVAQGSFPGTDPREPVRICAGETPECPSVPELPSRGPGADMVGRACGLLAGVDADFAVETTPTGWRTAGAMRSSGPRVMRRAQAWLSQDLEAAEAGLRGAPAIKFALAGPWTVAAAVESASGHRLVADPGVRGDLGAAYAELIADLVRRLAPLADQVVVQLDEPALPAVLDARLPTPSGLQTYRAVPSAEVRATLINVVDAAHAFGATVVMHCCAIPAPLQLLLETGADAVSLDLTRQSASGAAGHPEYALGELLESAHTLVAGVVDWSPDRPANPCEPVPVSTHRLLDLLHRLGVPLDACADRLAVSTPCGLAGATPDGARAVMQSVAATSAVIRKELA